MEELSFIEKYLLFPSLDCRFNLSSVVTIKGSVCSEQIKRALKTLQKKNWFLQVHIEEKPNPCFSLENTGEIPIKIKKRLGDKQWESVVEEELHIPLDLFKSPLMRLTFLEGVNTHELIFTFDHLLTDGVNLAYIIHEFLIILDKIKNNELFQSIRMRNRALPFEDNIVIPENTSSLITSKPLNNPKRTRITYHTFDKRITSFLIKFAKKNQIRMQALLSALLLKNAYQMMNRKEKVAFENHISVNLRPYMERVSYFDIGCFMNTLNVESELDHESQLIPLAHELNSSINKRLNSSLVNNTLIGCKHLVDSCKSFEELRACRNPNMPIIAASNIGKIPIRASYRSFEILNYYRFGAMHGTFYTEHDLFAAVSTFKDEMTIAFHMPAELIESKRITAFKEQFITMVKDLANLT